MTAAPDLLVLRCPYCGWFPEGDITQGVVKAHFDVEHPDDEFLLHLVARCPKCRDAMVHAATVGLTDHFECVPCHRSVSVTRSR